MKPKLSTQREIHGDDLFTAPQVAKICSTDLKTIHNWVNRGEIKSFRTPGRHLRFRPEDIREFLAKFGYPVPTGFATSARHRVVVIDTDQNTLRNIKRTLSRHFEVEPFENHIDALLSIGNRSPSLVLVNGDNGPEALNVVERLSVAPQQMPVAVYGAQADTEKTARKSGAQEFIPTSTSAGKEIRRRVSLMLKP